MSRTLLSNMPNLSDKDKDEIINLIKEGRKLPKEWQSFRTKKNPEIELESAWHEYEKKGRYKIAVKAVDILGQDTTQVIEVNVK
ncbi:MAG: hypothetical protein AABY50_00635 [Nitrospirota bacterium]